MLFTNLDIRILDEEDLLPMFLAASYTYYRLRRKLMSDETFDLLSSRLYNTWDNLEHEHKHLITKENLETQSGYNIEFPQDVVEQGDAWLRELDAS